MTVSSSAWKATLKSSMSVDYRMHSKLGDSGLTFLAAYLRSR